MKFEESATSVSQDNAHVERSCWEVQSLSRTLVHAAEAKHKMKTHLRHPLRAWAVRYAGQVISRFHCSTFDGKTPYELRKGRPYRRELPEFGESIMYLTVPRGKRRHKFEDRWLTGLFLGLVSRTSEVIVGTEKGCFKVSSIKRLSEQQSSNPELLEKLKGLPWKPRPNDGGDYARGSRDAESDYDVGPALDTGPVVREDDLPQMPVVSDPIRRAHNF